MITLPPSTTKRNSLMIKEAADQLSMSPQSFRKRLLDTGIVEKNFLGQIWPEHITMAYLEERIQELGLNLKVTTATKIKVMKKGIM